MSRSPVVGSGRATPERDNKSLKLNSSNFSPLVSSPVRASSPAPPAHASGGLACFALSLPPVAASDDGEEEKSLACDHVMRAWEVKRALSQHSVFEKYENDAPNARVAPLIDVWRGENGRVLLAYAWVRERGDALIELGGANDVGFASREEALAVCEAVCSLHEKRGLSIWPQPIRYVWSQEGSATVVGAGAGPETDLSRDFEALLSACPKEWFELDEFTERFVSELCDALDLDRSSRRRKARQARLAREQCPVSLPEPRDKEEAEKPVPWWSTALTGWCQAWESHRTVCESSVEKVLHPHESMSTAQKWRAHRRVVGVSLALESKTVIQPCTSSRRAENSAMSASKAMNSPSTELMSQGGITSYLAVALMRAAVKTVKVPEDVSGGRASPSPPLSSSPTSSEEESPFAEAWNDLVRLERTPWRSSALQRAVASLTRCVAQQRAHQLPACLRARAWGAILGAPEDEATRAQAYQLCLSRAKMGESEARDRNLHELRKQLALDLPRCHAYHPVVRRSFAAIERVLGAWLVGESDEEAHPSSVRAYWQGLDSVVACLLVGMEGDEVAAFSLLQRLTLPPSLEQHPSVFLDEDDSPSHVAALHESFQAGALGHAAGTSMKSMFSGMFLHRNHEALSARTSEFIAWLRFHDPLLYCHLANSGLSLSSFSTPWLLTAFAHVLKIETTLKVWDSLLVASGECSPSLALFAACVVIQLRDSLLSHNDDGELMMFLSRLPVSTDRLAERGMELAQLAVTRVFPCPTDALRRRGVHHVLSVTRLLDQCASIGESMILVGFENSSDDAGPPQALLSVMKEFFVVPRDGTGEDKRTAEDAERRDARAVVAARDAAGARFVGVWRDRGQLRSSSSDAELGSTTEGDESLALLQSLEKIGTCLCLLVEY